MTTRGAQYMREKRTDPAFVRLENAKAREKRREAKEAKEDAKYAGYDYYMDPDNVLDYTGYNDEEPTTDLFIPGEYEFYLEPETELNFEEVYQ